MQDEVTQLVLEQALNGLQFGLMLFLLAAGLTLVFGIMDCINLATKAGVEGRKLSIHAPLIDLSKADIIRAGTALGVDYGLTVSCYQADELGRACAVCDSCRLRAEGFAAAGLPDPTLYRA